MAEKQNPTAPIEKQAFPVVFRGYDRKAVDGKFAELKTAVAALASERDAAKARVQELEGRFEALEQREKEITDALVVASRVRADSERDAKAEAEKILSDARSRMSALEQEVRDTEQLAARTRGQLTSFLESTLSEIERRGSGMGSAVDDLVKRAGEAGRSELGKLKSLAARQPAEEEPAPEAEPRREPEGAAPA
jgi:cell division septum initiation protein DivIVA